MKPRLKGQVLLATLALSLGLAVACPSAAETSSTRELSSTSIEVSRDVHKFRHWKWSGIFPFYGSWVPDPHFVVTPVSRVPGDVGQVLGDPSARYQGVDINPWFKDTTSEIVLAIESGGVVHEYTIPNELDPPLGYGFINNGGRLHAFPYGPGLAFFTSLDIDRDAFVLVTLPLQKAGHAAVVSEGSVEYENVIDHLGSTGRYRSLKQNPCRGLRDLYERFEKCPD